MQTRLYSPTPANLHRLARALQRGELVALPTETVYGLAAHALDAKACRKIFTAKRRPANDPLIVHVSGLRDAEKLAEFNDAARVLARRFWPGPLTLVLPKRDVVPAIVTSGQATVAVRAPAHPLARCLLKLSGLPLAAPSANLFGYVSPTSAAHVVNGLGGRIRYVLAGGECNVGVESTIVDLSVPKQWRLLRPGAITPTQISAALRKKGIKFVQKKPGKNLLVPLAPGMLDQHYSPRTKFALMTQLEKEADAPDTAKIYWQKPRGPRAANMFWLSACGSAQSAAHALYAVLRQVDTGGFKLILCQPAPANAGALAEAINDRLTRAAGRR
ncbi:MAG: L-threonylcarbamoyladenylate synthase [Candidatus Didemnitutus sp.]|nr:L-threonylcarbamoyladenylate synthase [Candidatus Didemnitutus sp.]